MASVSATHENATATHVLQKLPGLEEVEEFSRKELGAELQRVQQVVEENKTLRYDPRYQAFHALC